MICTDPWVLVMEVVHAPLQRPHPRQLHGNHVRLEVQGHGAATHRLLSALALPHRVLHAEATAT